MQLAGGDGNAVAQALGMMERQLGHMVRLIDDLLDIARINQDKMEPRRSHVLLTDVVSSAVETARPAIAAVLIGQRLPKGAGEDSSDIGPALRGEKLDRPIREATVLHNAEGVFAIGQGPGKPIAAGAAEGAPKASPGSRRARTSSTTSGTTRRKPPTSGPSTRMWSSG